MQGKMATVITALVLAGTALAHGGWGPGGPHGRGHGPWWARHGPPPTGYWQEPAPVLDPAASAATGAADRGGQLYASYCAGCHGSHARGRGRAPDLLAAASQRDDGYLTQVISRGRGAMPAWGGVLGSDAIHAIVAYLRELVQAPQLR